MSHLAVGYTACLTALDSRLEAMNRADLKPILRRLPKPEVIKTVDFIERHETAEPSFINEILLHGLLHQNQNHHA